MKRETSAQRKSSEVAAVPLEIFAYEGFFEEQPDHKDFDARWRVLSARLPTPGFYRNA